MDRVGMDARTNEHEYLLHCKESRLGKYSLDLEKFMLVKKITYGTAGESASV